MSTAPVSRSFSNDGVDAELGSRKAHTAVPNPAQVVAAGEEAHAAQAQLLVLSRNPELVEVVRNAARSVARVAQARDLDDAVRSLSHIDPGVLLIDGTITADLGTLLTQVTRRFAEAVVVVVGNREAGSELMQLTAAGRIFRFLLMPLSYGPVRLAVAAAATHYIERRAANRTIASMPAETGPTRRKYALLYVALTGALCACIGVLWRVSGSFAPPPPAPQLTARAVPVKPVPTQLALAAKALAAGQLVEPSGNSALDLYRSVLRSDPDSDAARRGIRAIADEFVQRAEQALLAESLDEAESSLLLVRSIEAEHPRLAFLDSRVARERELRDLTEQRDAANRVRQLVGTARRDMLAGDLIGTAAGGALGALLAARKLAPTDPSVVQSIRELNAALADAVLKATTAGDSPRSKAFADAARKLGSGEQLLAAIDRSLQEPKRSALPMGPPSPPPSAAPTVPPSTSASPSPSTANLPRSEQPIVATAEPGPSGDEILQAAALPRIRQVMPSYPKAAAAAGIEGYVDLEFTISTEGIPRNLTVVGANPRRMFESAAINCLRQWRFEPIEQNGLPATPRAVLRVRFQLR